MVSKMNQAINTSEDRTKASNEVILERVSFDNETFFKISNSDALRPFFMTVVSDSNHWMFISSNGGISAGRKDADNALFPYYTDDKITESFDITGSKTVLWVTIEGNSMLWEPFSERQFGAFNIARNLYKNELGNKILFEEVNQDLNLVFRYQWCSSKKFGFVRKSTITNNSGHVINIKMLDGIQNIMPYGVPADVQATRSNLVDAYKKNELEAEIGLGIYALSAIIVDKAEPSEALKANTVWSHGLDNPIYLISSLQLNDFRAGSDVHQEIDIKAEKGAYFVTQNIRLDSNEQKDWTLVANVNQTASSIAELSKRIKTDNSLITLVNNDIEEGSERLLDLVSASDGIQFTSDRRRNARHYSNTLFNIMRGGIFDFNYQIEKWDFDHYLLKANRASYLANKDLLEKLPKQFSLQSLRKLAYESDDKNFRRLALEYMPLKFSRRHGDPSRPWNRFTINTVNETDGSRILDYEGNWRDIFQNWEALAKAYPEFIDSMIHKFLNASTFDGYNPYRVTKSGFDWEIIEEHDPWSYIGYWGDHQIIYVLKFLEFIHDHYPNKLDGLLNESVFVYANVPYKIKPYGHILANPKDTIDFDHKLDKEIRKKRDEIGADGAILCDKNGVIYNVTFMEKILATSLAKLSNFIPEGGIWLNTQRPEWNDANNALVGNGVSMVTLYYLRRFFNFFKIVLETSKQDSFEISLEIQEFFSQVQDAFLKHHKGLEGKISDKTRKHILDALGIAGSQYRNDIYSKSFSGKKEALKLKDLKSFIDMTLAYLDHSIRANQRDDKMYHAYNLMTVNGDGVSISYLDEMLEGQVAVLSSGYLSPESCVEVLDGMKQSRLFREDQYSYILYPNKNLSRFVDKNCIPEDKVKSSSLLQQLANDGNSQIIQKDVNGNYHFHGSFNNANFLKKELLKLKQTDYSDLITNDLELVLQIYEDVFNHKAFTGRSGTFYGYEGLGSIYWHMVSKLLLAVQENCIMAYHSKAPDQIFGRLLEHYYEINEGIGIHKSPKLYGAFPIDPYSHTPEGKGAQQPGMTGQVKEDILSRIGELGVFVHNGQIEFKPFLLRTSEFLDEPGKFVYTDLNQNKKEIQLYKYELAFTYCQVPVVYSMAGENSIEVYHKSGAVLHFKSLVLDGSTSQKLFERTGEIINIKVNIEKSLLK